MNTVFSFKQQTLARKQPLYDQITNRLRIKKINFAKIFVKFDQKKKTMVKR